MAFTSILLLFLLPLFADALRFDRFPVTADTEVLIVNRPAKLTCNYVKYRTEKIVEIKWFAGYTGFRSEIFEYKLSTGVKKGSVYPFIQTDVVTATDSELRVTLTDFRAPNMTFACEVESLRDDGYGKLKQYKKLGESVLTVIDSVNHDLFLKPDPDLGLSAIPGKPVTVTCVSRGSDPAPRLSIKFGGQNVTEMYSGTLEQVSTGHSKEHAVTGTLRYPTEDNFKNGRLLVECLAHYEDFMFAKKELELERKSESGGYDYSSNGNNRPTYTTSNSRPSYESHSRPAYGSSSRPTYASSNNNRMDEGLLHDNDDDSFFKARKGRVEEGHEADVIHARLMDLVDPARHVHPGIPYDFFAGYIIMHADSVNPDSVNNGYVTLLGELPFDVESSLQSNYGRVNKISEQKMRVKLEAAQVLNLLGALGYRVSGSSNSHGNEFIWTLERRNFQQGGSTGVRGF